MGHPMPDSLYSDVAEHVADLQDAWLCPGLLRQSLHHEPLWFLLWIVMMPTTVMHHHPMYRA